MSPNPNIDVNKCLQGKRASNNKGTLIAHFFLPRLPDIWETNLSIFSPPPLQWNGFMSLAHFLSRDSSSLENGAKSTPDRLCA